MSDCFGIKYSATCYGSQRKAELTRVFEALNPDLRGSKELSEKILERQLACFPNRLVGHTAQTEQKAERIKKELLKITSQTKEQTQLTGKYNIKIRNYLSKLKAELSRNFAEEARQNLIGQIQTSSQLQEQLQTWAQSSKRQVFGLLEQGSNQGLLQSEITGEAQKFSALAAEIGRKLTEIGKKNSKRLKDAMNDDEKCLRLMERKLEQEATRPQQLLKQLDEWQAALLDQISELRSSRLQLESNSMRMMDKLIEAVVSRKGQFQEGS